MPSALVPQSVAVELGPLVERMRGLLERGELDGLPAISSHFDAQFPAPVLVRIALADVDHCVQLATRFGAQLPAARWQSLLNELQSIDRQFASMAPRR
jgi:hypothetical protein